MLLRIVLINNGYAIYSIKHSEEERSIGLWRRYINATITILDIIDRFVFYLKHDVSEIVFFLRLQVEPTQLGPIDRRDYLYLLGSTEYVSLKSGQNPVSETSCLK
jgi:hypothetical protein